MPTCPKCRRHFRVLEDEDDGQHGCPSCGYGDRELAVFCEYCSTEVDPDDCDMEHAPFCSAVCAINAQAEDDERNCA